MSPTLALILPCYNEEEVIDSSYSKLKALFDDLVVRNVIDPKSKLFFIDDGSKDNTWQKIESFNTQPYVKGIKLSRNYGHQYALLAGLTSQADLFDIYISIDADLQDDISTIEEMVSHYQKGSKVVYGVRNDRSSDSFFKRKTAEIFYKLMSKLGVESVYNHADYRLIDNDVLKSFLGFQEQNLFLRGIFPKVGYPSSIVYYRRKEREAGVSKYPFGKMLAFAWDGVSSFSVKPLRLILYLGFTTFFLSLILLVWALIAFMRGVVIPGWFSIIIPVTIFGGIQMISIGIIGEYVGKIYTETKSRPRFIIEKEI